MLQGSICLPTYLPILLTTRCWSAFNSVYGFCASFDQVILIRFVETVFKNRSSGAPNMEFMCVGPSTKETCTRGRSLSVKPRRAGTNPDPMMKTVFFVDENGLGQGKIRKHTNID